MLPCEAPLHSNNKQMMKARYYPTEQWLCMWFVRCGCPGNPQSYGCLLRVLIIGPPFILYAVVSPHHDLHIFSTSHNAGVNPPTGFKAFEIQWAGLLRTQGGFGQRNLFLDFDHTFIDTIKGIVRSVCLQWFFIDHC